MPMNLPASSIIKTGVKPVNQLLGLSGSPRKKGNSDILLNRILDGAAQENITSTHLNLTDIRFQGCIGCERCRKDKICTGLVDGMSVMYNQILSSKGLVLVSPTHNYNVTSWMKAFIDRLYCFYNFEDVRPRAWSSQLANQGRKAVIAAVCEQESKADMGFTIEAMKNPLEALGYDIVGELAVFSVFDKARVKKETSAMENAFELGVDLGKSIQSDGS